MSRQSLFLPISLLATGVMLIVLMLTRPSTQLQATHQRQDETATAYPVQLTETVRVLKATQTAGAGGSAVTPTAYPAPGTPTTTPPGSGATQQPTARPTSGALPPIATFPASPVIPPTAAPVQPTVAAPPPTVPRPTATPTPIPTATSTPTPTPDPNKLTCLVGQPVTIAGTGPANAGLLLRFAGRVVGGGSVDGAGNYSLTMVVGVETPGVHPVTIELRDRRSVLRELTCTIPPYTITATPAQRPSVP